MDYFSCCSYMQNGLPGWCTGKEASIRRKQTCFGTVDQIPSPIVLEFDEGRGQFDSRLENDNKLVVIMTETWTFNSRRLRIAQFSWYIKSRMQFTMCLSSAGLVLVKQKATILKTKSCHGINIAEHNVIKHLALVPV